MLRFGHLLHGQTILVQRSARHGREVWLCEHDLRTAAIQVWMTDRAACAALSVGPVAVSVEPLSELALLVNAARSAHDRVIDLPQEEHDATSTAETTPMPFEREVSTVVLPAQIAQELVRTLADLLLASAVAADHDEERDDARKDHR